MHELGVVFHVIKKCEEVAKENDVKEIKGVTLQLGEVSGVLHDYLQDAWKWAAANRSEIMHEAKLKIETIPAITFCEDCNQEYSTVEHGKICPNCGSEHTYLIQGNEFLIKEIEVE